MFRINIRAWKVITETDSGVAHYDSSTHIFPILTASVQNFKIGTMIKKKAKWFSFGINQFRSVACAFHKWKQQFEHVPKVHRQLAFVSITVKLPLSRLLHLNC